MLAGVAILKQESFGDPRVSDVPMMSIAAAGRADLDRRSGVKLRSDSEGRLCSFPRALAKDCHIPPPDF
jgi:hypothetical protein